MSLADEIRAAGRESPRCGLGKILDGLVEEERQELEEILADPSYANRVIVAVLRSHGYMIGVDLMGRHRRGDCRCKT